MQRSLAISLQAAVVLFGAAALAFLLWEPHLEGRNAHAALFEIYFKDPFLAFAYLASVPFFAALWQAYGALGRAGRGMAFSPETAKALRIIKICALCLIGAAAAGEVYIIFGVSDDRAGGVFIGGLIALASGAAAAAAARLERAVREKL